MAQGPSKPQTIQPPSDTTVEVQGSMPRGLEERVTADSETASADVEPPVAEHPESAPPAPTGDKVSSSPPIEPTQTIETPYAAEPHASGEDHDEASVAGPDSGMSRDILTADPSEHLIELRNVCMSTKEELEYFHARSEAQEALVRRMQSQIDKLRADQIRSLLKPLLISLADLHTEAVKTSSRDIAAIETTDPAKEFMLFADSVEEAIAQLGFDSIKAVPGAAFDAEYHTAVRMRSTDDPILDRSIANVRRQGFAAPEDKRPILYARVDVYRYQGPQSDDARAAASESANPNLSEAPSS